MGERAVIYARVSSDEQTKGYSLQTQIEACRRYAEEHGMTVAEVFTDDFTGTKMDRPGLDALRDLLARDSIGAVIVFDLDRLARKAIYQMLLEEEFRKAGARTYYVRGDYDDSDEGRLQKQIRAAIAEFERAKILERSKRGLRGKARSGYVVVGARPPYGYRLRSEPHKAWLVVDEDEARVVRLIFRWYVYGDGENGPLSIRAIARKLTELHIPTRGDKAEHVWKSKPRCVWQPAVVAKILRNETYTGVWHYNKWDFTHGRKQKRRSTEEWIAVPVPAIIERDLWEAAQKRLALNKRFAPRNTRWPYLLQHRLTCLACGYAVSPFTKVRPNGHATSYYRCNAAIGNVVGRRCGMPSFRADQLEPAVWGWVADLLLHPDQLAEGLRARQAEAEEEAKALRDRLGLVEKSIADHDRQIEKLLDLYLSGDDFPKELLTQRKKELVKAREELEEERATLARALEAATVSDAAIEEVEAFCRQVREGLEHATFEDKRRIIELLDVRGQLAVEDGQKVVYVSCVIDQARLSIESPSPWCWSRFPAYGLR